MARAVSAPAHRSRRPADRTPTQPGPCPVCRRPCLPLLHQEILAAAARLAAPAGELGRDLPDWAITTARVALGDLPLRVA